MRRIVLSALFGAVAASASAPACARDGGQTSPKPAPTVRAHRDRAADPHRRQARRGDLPDHAGDHRLRAAGAGRIQARHREDRGVDLLRQRQRLHLGAELGIASRAARRQRDAARHQPAAPERHLRRAVRHLPRQAQRLHLLRERDRRPGRQPGHRRGTAQRRLEHGVGRAHRQLRRRLDDRDGDPVQVAALSAGHRSGVGRQPAARRAMEERMVVPRAGAARADDVPRTAEGVVGRQPRGAAGAVGPRQPRSEAVRARRRLDRQHRDAARSTTTATAASAAT